VVTEIVDATAEEYRDQLLVPAARALEPIYSVKALDAVVVRSCRVIEVFTRDAFREIQRGFADFREGLPEPPPGISTVVETAARAQRWRVPPEAMRRLLRHG
jgi:hypothetical protein